MHIIACRNIVPVCNSVYLTHPLQKAILEAAGHSISLSLNTATTEDRKLSLYCTNTGEREQVIHCMYVSLNRLHATGHNTGRNE